MAVKYNQCSVVIALLLLVGGGQRAMAWIDEMELKLYKLFEEALTNSTESLYQLQQVYFNPDSKQSPGSVCASINITVDGIMSIEPDSPCMLAFECLDGYNSTNCSGPWSFASTYLLQLSDDESVMSQLTNLLTASGSTGVLFAFDPFFYTIMKVLSNSLQLSFPWGILMLDSLFDTYYDEIDLVIHVSSELEEMPCREDAVNALRMVLVWVSSHLLLLSLMMFLILIQWLFVFNLWDWAQLIPNFLNNFYGAIAQIACLFMSCHMQTKAYARNTGEKLEMDRSSATESDCCRLTYPLIDPMNLWLLFICVFVISNLLVLTSTLFNFHRMLLWLQRQENQAKILYKASVIVLPCVSILALLADIVVIIEINYDAAVDDYIFGTLDIFFLILPVKVPMVLLLLCLETSVVCFYTHKINPRSHKQRCCRITQAFALCQIIWFVHRLVNDAIISVVFFILAPAQTLAIITLLLSTIGSTIAFVAIIIYKGRSKKLCSFVCCATFNGLMISGLLFVITVLYIVFVDNGLKSAGIGGHILSLIPPLLATALGYTIRERYFKSQTVAFPAGTTTPGELQEVHQITPVTDSDCEEPRQEEKPLQSGVTPQSKYGV